MERAQGQYPGASETASELAATTDRKADLQIRLRHGLLFLLPLAVLSTLAGYRFADVQDKWMNWLIVTPAQAANSSSSAASLDAPAAKNSKTESDIEQISHLTPQQQAERLLELAIRQPDPSVEVIQKNLASWHGHLQDTTRLFHIVLAALEADDMRVRTAALEIDLAANHLNESKESLARLLRQIRTDADSRYLALWRLGALGNRGVEPGTVLKTLLRYTHDAKQQTRFWAVEGLAMLGTEDSVQPLLSILAEDPSPQIRERAACNLARSGMLTDELRFNAIPHLLNLLDDDSLDDTTLDLVYASLQVISGASLGRDAKAWREWWAHHDRREKAHRLPKNLVTA